MSGSLPLPRLQDGVSQFMASCPIAIAGTDATHRIRYCNPAFEHLFRYRSSEALGQKLETLVGFVDNKEAATALTRVWKGEPIHLTTRAQRKDRTAIDVEFHGVPKTIDGPFTGYWGLFQDITERKRMEHLLRVSREVFKKAFHASPMTVALATSPDNRLIDVNDTWLRVTGYNRNAVIGRTPLDLGLLEDPRDFDRINDRVRANHGHLRDFECRFRSADRRLIVGLVSIEQFEVEQQTFRIVMVADITALRQAEATLSQVTQNVIEAQEWERLRIARDLHDDIGQRLAVWQFTMDRLLHDVQHGAPQVEPRLHDLQKQARSIAADLQSLSRELHSPTLSLIRIDKSLKRLCEEVGARLGIHVDFTSSHVPQNVAPEVSLCLFRVLQEALANVVKHSGTRRAIVHLAGTGAAVEMKVRDFGHGLSPDSAATSVGIGLVTMRERVAMVKGTFSIASPSDGGLEIEIRLPLEAPTASPNS